MPKRSGLALFRRLERVFWVIWALYPITIAIVAFAALGQREALLASEPGFAACASLIPDVGSFSLPGKALFWALFAFEFAYYGAVLALAHFAISRCARGDVFVGDVIATLRLVGWLIVLWPALALSLSNVAMYAFRVLGDTSTFRPDYAFDLTVFGVGLLIVALAAAIRQAVAYKRDSELTI